MAHKIAKIAGKDAMAYLGETPWHRLGTPMIGFPDVDTALKAASLDWQVNLQPVYLAGPKGNLGAEVPRCKAVVRDIDDQVLATVGDVYELIQNREAFGVLDTACKQHGVHIETAGALGIGDRVWMLAKLPNAVEPVKGDKVEGFFLITTGHNGWTSYEARLTPIRVVCHNTLTAAVNQTEAIIKLRHVRTQVEQVEEVEHMVTGLVEALKETGASFTKLASKKLSLSEINTYIDSVLGIKTDTEVKGVVKARREQVFSLATGAGKGAEFAPLSAWTAYNAITEYVDHIVRSNAQIAADRRKVGKGTSPRLLQADSSALFGSNLKLKEKALELALELVKA